MFGQSDFTGIIQVKRKILISEHLDQTLSLRLVDNKFFPCLYGGHQYQFKFLVRLHGEYNILIKLCGNTT